MLKKLFLIISLFVVLLSAAGAQTVPLGPRFVLPYQTVVDPTGVPIPGAQLWFYSSGTNTPLNTYSDPLLTTPNSNPVVANAAGVFPTIFLDGNYKIVLTDSAVPPNQIWTADPVFGLNNNLTPTSSDFAAVSPLAVTFPSGVVTYSFLTQSPGTIFGVDQKTNSGLTAPSFLSIIPWAAQVHQNGGGTSNGHNLIWADQNISVTADLFSLHTDDQSLIYTLTIGGSPAAGNTLTATFTLATVAYPVVYTVQGGDTPTTIATAFAACINGGSTHCTGGGAFVVAMKAFLGSDGIGYKPSAGASGAVLSFDFPWASSGNSIVTSATGGGATITLGGGTNLDNSPIMTTGRNVPGRTPVGGDQFFNLQMGRQSGPNTGIDANCVLMPGLYLGGTVGHVYSAVALGGAANSNQGPLAIYFGPMGVYTADTAGDGNGCGGFSVDAYSASDPGFGNVSVCGAIYVGAGIGSMGLSTVYGTKLEGTGSSYDVSLFNKNNQWVCGVQTGATVFTCNALEITFAQMALGSDATGDMYYRNSSGNLTRLPVCTGTQVLGASGGIPACVTQGGTGAALSYLCTITASNSSSLNNASPTSGSCPINNSYTSYKLVFQSIIPVTDSKILELQIHSTAGGAGYKTTGYSYAIGLWSTNTANVSNSNTSTYIPLTYPADSNNISLHNAAPGFSGEIMIMNPSASGVIPIFGQIFYIGAGGTAYYGTGQTGGSWLTTGIVDGFQVLMDSGNISSGSILVYGVQ